MRFFLFLSSLLLAVGVAVAAGLPPLVNRLAESPSPYLAMHGHDPVHWQNWGADVLQRARQEDKLIYVSSGYFSCHWCHVMQRESYSDPGIADLLNRYFIPVKVDRELLPALDRYLIDFVQRTHGSAGWPLNVFLTPEGLPLAGLTYAPPERFRRILERIHNAWMERREKLRQAAREMQKAQQEEEEETTAEAPALPKDLTPLRQLLLQQALAYGDDLEGGFGNQRRFPMAPHLEVLLALQAQQPRRHLGKFLRLTLDQMARKGLRDHLAGGFFRYTTDPGWQTPHYEKMLYTQALLSRLYLHSAGVLDRPEDLDVVRDTLDFTLKAMRGEGGGFISSLSAVDPQGVEGGAYLWPETELKRILTPEELALAGKRWGMEGTPHSPGGYLPMLKMSLDEAAKALGMTPKKAAALEDSARRKLLAAHARRAHPRDGKQLAGWNGLMLSALADAVDHLHVPRYRRAGQALRDYLVQRLWDGKALHRARRGDHWVGRASLQDYAFVAQGLADWARVSGSDEDRALARRLVEAAWKRFYTGRGWSISDTLLIPGAPAEPVLQDGPMPSPAATIIDLSFRLERDRPGPLSHSAEQALRVGYPDIAEFPFGHPSHAWMTLRWGPSVSALAVAQSGAVRQ